MEFHNKKGIIKVKCGYNANSSSVASSVSSFQFLPAISTTILVVILIVFYSTKDKIFNSNKKDEKEEKDEIIDIEEQDGK